MNTSVRASVDGLVLVDRARQRRGWTKISTAQWWQDAHTSKATLRRFWQRERIQQEIFIAICQTVGISDWQAVAEPDGILEAESPLSSKQQIPDLDWEDAPDLQHFYGRSQELRQLEQWAVQDHCKVLLITGLAGVGKTALALNAAEQVQTRFTHCIWRSLHSYTTLNALLDSLLYTFGKPAPADRRSGIQQVMAYLQQHCCLMVLDGLEKVELTQDWHEFFQRLSCDRHSSCTIITSRERPAVIEAQLFQSVRCLRIEGLQPKDAIPFLENLRLVGTPLELTALTQRYSGHPLALQVASSLIHSIFGGTVKAFLGQSFTTTDLLQDLLNQQWIRLSGVEQAIAYWLVIWQEPISLSRLQSHWFPSPDPTLLLKGITTLERQSLLSKCFSEDVPLFTLAPLVMTFVTHRLIEQVAQEIEQVLQSHSTESLRAMRTHRLLRPGTDDIKGDAILIQLQQHLLSKYGETLFLTIEYLCERLQRQPPRKLGYAIYNLTQLLKVL